MAWFSQLCFEQLHTVFRSGPHLGKPAAKSLTNAEQELKIKASLKKNSQRTQEPLIILCPLIFQPMESNTHTSYVILI